MDVLLWNYLLGGIEEKFGDKFLMKCKEDESLYLLHDHILPHDHMYFAQVQGEMAILGIEWCDCCL